MQKGEVFVWRGFTNSWGKKRSEKKKERERYTQLNAEFQRIARREKKAFLYEQYKKTEDNNRMGKTRDLFKKIGDIKGKFHAKMDTMKDRNGKDLTEAERIKKKWQEYTEEWYKKALKDADNPMVWSLTWSQTSGMWSQVGLMKHYYEQS